MNDVITQAELHNTACIRQCYAEMQADLKRRRRAGASVETGPYTLNAGMLTFEIPKLATMVDAEAIDPCSPAWASRIRELIGGADVADLESRGLHEAAVRQRRVNLTAYRAMLNTGAERASRKFAELRAELRDRNEWSEAGDILSGAGSLKWGIFLLRAAGFLYGLHIPYAVRLAGRALDSMGPLLAALRPPAEVIEFPARA